MTRLGVRLAVGALAVAAIQKARRRPLSSQRSKK
jgi:hypothetical protein